MNSKQSPDGSSLPTESSDIEKLRERIVFNVGGTKFETYRSTLTARPNTLLGTMFAERNSALLRCGSDGSFFFDRDPKCFQCILNYFRTGRIFCPPSVNPELLLEEFSYFQIPAEMNSKGEITLTKLSRSKNKNVETFSSSYRIGTADDHFNYPRASSEASAFEGSGDAFDVDEGAGCVYTWGRGDFGQLGHGDRATLGAPCLVDTLLKQRLSITKISLGTSHTCCVTSNGLAFSWGYGGDGRLGHGDENDRLVPTKIEALSSVVVKDIVCGELHSAAIASEGKLFTWGLGKDGRLGMGNRESVLIPKEVVRLTTLLEHDNTIVQVACGGLHTAALAKNGDVYTWGLGKNGRLGHGDEEDQLYPMKIGLKNINFVACGGHHSGVIDLHGAVYTWGFDDDGRLGHLETGHRLRPTLVETLLGTTIIQLSLGCWHSAALDAEGSVYTWGSCKSGQLGQSHKNSMPVPQVAFTGKHGGAVRIACGTAHTAALCKDGTLYTWGKNEDGRLGYSSDGDQITPRRVDIVGPELIVDVVCGVYNTACIGRTRD